MYMAYFTPPSQSTLLGSGVRTTEHKFYGESRDIF